MYAQHVHRLPDDPSRKWQCRCGFRGIDNEGYLIRESGNLMQYRNLPLIFGQVKKTKARRVVVRFHNHLRPPWELEETDSGLRTVPDTALTQVMPLYLELKEASDAH